MDSTFRNVDMLQPGLAQFYSQAMQKQTFKSCQVPRNTKKKKKSVKVTGIIMQSTANSVLKKKKKTTNVGCSIFVYGQGFGLGKSIIMWELFSCYQF